MQKIDLHALTTEQRNLHTQTIDQVSTAEMLRLMNEEDQKVAPAVAMILPQIAAAVDTIVAQLKLGGRLIYIGAGTSGRLGVLDAVECPPTYSVSADLVQGMIAGGPAAIFKAQEGAEDDPALGEADLAAKDLAARDVVVGIAASGRTPYVIGALNYANRVGAKTIAVTCNENAPIRTVAQIALVAQVGAEVIAGSTRMKAGTAQKLILNMLSTGAMIRLGKVYGNLMVDVHPSNAKLVERARNIVVEATGVTYEESVKYLAMTQQNVKLAIFLILSKLPLEKAALVLEKHDGYIAKALASLAERG